MTLPYYLGRAFKGFILSVFGRGSEAPPDVPDTISCPVEGLTRYSITRFGAMAEVILADPKKWKYQVSDWRGSRKDVHVWAEEMGAFVAGNGDGWNGVPEYNWPNSLAASEGRVYQTYHKDDRPVLNETEDGILQLTHYVAIARMYNCCSFDRYLVQNGEVNSALYSRTKEKNARTIGGITEDGKLLFICVYGWDVHKPSNGAVAPLGWSFVESAEVAKEFRAKIAGNFDGGGSTGLVLDGEYIISQNQDGVAENRPVCNAWGLVPRKGVVIPDPTEPSEPPTPPVPSEGGAMFQVINSVRIRTEPNFFAPGIGDASAGLLFESLQAVPDSKPVPTAIYEVVWQEYQASKFVPMRHHTQDVAYVKKVDVPQPPQPRKVISALLTYDDGSTQEMVPINE